MIRTERLRDMPIRAKLRTIVLVISGASVIGCCGVFLTYQWIASKNALAHRLEVTADIVGDQSTAALEFDQPEQATAILNALKAERQIVGAGVYTAGGTLFARYVRDGAGLGVVPESPSADGSIYERGNLRVFRPIRSAGERVGTFYIRSDLSDTWQRLWFNLAAVFLVLLGATAATLYLTGRLGGIVTAPILRLADVVALVTRTRDYSVRVERSGHDELGRLIDGFNDMLSQIQERDAALARARDDLEARVMERTAELAAANRELEGFSYSVSHDLRAPLRAIDGFSQLLAEHPGAGLDAEGQRYLAVIQRNAKRMGQLIDDLLAFSRMGRGSLEATRIDMERMADDVFRELREAEPARRVDFMRGPLPEGRGDPAMIRQVFVNLLSNAMKYTRGREPARIEVGAREGADGSIYYVKDNGAGFDMQYAGGLFGVFQRLHRAEEFEGTGVGLALVRRIVERHKGRVWAEGRLDEGATFYFCIPDRIAEKGASHERVHADLACRG